MANQDQQPPWGKKPNNPEDFLAQLIDKLQDFFAEDRKRGSTNTPRPSQSPPPSPLTLITRMLAVLLGVAVIFGAATSFYKIEPGKVGVILRLGKYHATTQPGLHFKIPYLDHLKRVDVEKVRKEEFGFATRSRRNFRNANTPDTQSLMITADKNVISVAWIVQYKVGDPYAWLYVVQNPEQAIRDMSESVTRRIVGNMDFDYVLGNRALLAGMVKSELQKMLDGLFPKGRSGIKVGTVQFKDINVPGPVQPAFNEVNIADQDMKRLVNEAQEIYNQKIPKARGNAKKIVEEAWGYRAQRINQAQGESQRFLDILAAYRKAPEVTRRRIYLETMEQVLPQVKEVYVIDQNQQQAPIPLLNLNKTALPTQGAQ